MANSLKKHLRSILAKEWGSQEALDKYLTEHGGRPIGAGSLAKSDEAAKKQFEKYKGKNKGTKKTWKDFRDTSSDEPEKKDKPKKKDKGKGTKGITDPDEVGEALKGKGIKIEPPADEDFVAEFSGEIPEYHLEIIAGGEGGELSEADLRRAKAVMVQFKRGVQAAADICEMSPPVCADNLGVYRESMPQLSADESIQTMVLSDADRIADNGGGDGFQSPSQGWKKVPFDQLSDKERAKARKGWAKTRKKGQAAIDAGADPDDDRTVFKQLLDGVADEGVKISSQEPPFEKVAVGRLKATQREIQAEKTFGIANSYFSGVYDPRESPIIISADNHILDGHHRYAAMITADPDAKMNVVRVDMKMKDFLERSFEQPGVFRADIQDNIVDSESPLDLSRAKGSTWQQKGGKWYAKDGEGKTSGPYEAQEAADVAAKGKGKGKGEKKARLRGILADEGLTASPSYSGNPDGKPIYPNEIDHGYTQPLAGGSDIMKRVVDRFRIEQGSEPREKNPRLALLARYHAKKLRTAFQPPGDDWIPPALDELENFMRSVGQSDEERDVLSIRIHVKVRSWRGRFNRGQLTARDRAAIQQALRDTRAYR